MCALVRRFESLMLLYFIPAMVSNLGLQYMTFVVVSIVRPFSFATMFNCVNMLYVTSSLSVISVDYEVFYVVT